MNQHECHDASQAFDPVRLVTTPGEKRLLVIILRGAMDGLDAVQPYGDPNLRALRPGLSVGPEGGAYDLDGFFALHPALATLMPLWTAGQLAFAHAVSTPDRDRRSHFDGQDVLEIGGGKDTSQNRTGWLNRLVSVMPGAQENLAMASASMTPLIARGPAPFSTWYPGTNVTMADATKTLLDRLLEEDNSLRQSFLRALQTSELFAAKAAALTDAGLVAEHFNRGGTIAYMGRGGWDTHANQTDVISRRFTDLAKAILQIKASVSAPVWDNLVIACVTEFGRTVRVNGSGGTDHGTASCAIFAGGAVAGGKVYGDWPGLENLYGNRDLMPTRDVRDYLAAICHAHMGVSQTLLSTVVFPGVEPVCPPVG